MTKEPQITAQHLVWEAVKMGNMAGVYEHLDDAFQEAEQAARAEEQQKCMADVCEGCSKGWPLDPVDIKGEVAFHRRPHITYEDAGEEIFRCGAWKIRNRTSS